MGTIEGNKLIAEFMGLWESEVGYLYNPQFEAGFKPEELKYHSSWDWLMPVIEKIEHTYCYVNIKGCLVTMSDIINVSSPTKIEAVWLACVEFIKWYNDQKK